MRGSSPPRAVNERKHTSNAPFRRCAAYRTCSFYHRGGERHESWLLNLTEDLQTTIHQLQDENQRLRDENNRLKGELIVLPTG